MATSDKELINFEKSIKALLEFGKDTASVAEVVEAIQIVMAFIKRSQVDIEAKATKGFNLVEERINEVLKIAKQSAKASDKSTDTKITDAKRVLVKFIRKVEKDIKDSFPETDLSDIEGRIQELEDAGFLKDTDMEKLELSVLSQMPLQNVMEIIEAINGLDPTKDQWKIDAKHIKNLPAAVQNFFGGDSSAPFELPIREGSSNVHIRKDPSGAWVISVDPGGGGGSSNTPRYESLANQDVDDSNVTYELALAPVNNSLMLFINEALISPSRYTLVGTTVTLNAPLGSAFSGLPFDAFYQTSS